MHRILPTAALLATLAGFAALPPTAFGDADAEVEEKTVDWARLKFPKSARPGEEITIEATIPATAVQDEINLMVGLHLVDANRQRTVTARNTGPFRIVPGQETVHQIRVRLPDQVVAYWIFPVWLTAGESWVRDNPYATTQLHVANSAVPAPAPRAAAPARIEVQIEDPSQPGLYTHPGGELAWQFRIHGGQPSLKVESLRVEIEEDNGDFRHEIVVAVAGNRSERLSVLLPRLGYYSMRAVPGGVTEGIVAYQGGLAAVPVPNPIDAASPWGAMRALHRSFEAELARILGVSWVRHTTWGAAVKTMEPEIVADADANQFLEVARKYKAQGLHIMATLQAMPTALSSRPDDRTHVGDAGPLRSRVAARDWDEYQRYVESLVAQLDHLIDYWEIGNEPNLPGRYWAGTVEEFTELVKRAGRAIRSVNPANRLLLSGFTLDPHGPPYLNRMLELGAGDYLDILSVHSLYGKSMTVGDMRSVLQRHGIQDVPVWSTEPKHVLPLRNFAEGVSVNMHFLLINLSPADEGYYSNYPNLAERDGSATRAGLAYALCAKIIGTAEFKEMLATGVANAEAALFSKGDAGAMIAVNAEAGPRGAALQVRVTPIGEQTAIYIDLTGKSENVQAGDLFTLPLDRSGILYGASAIEVVGRVIPEPTLAEFGIEVYANQATLKGGFQTRSDAKREHYTGCYVKPENVPPHPQVDFPVEIAEAGTYGVYVVSQWFPSNPQLTSPFSWRFNQGDWVSSSPASATTHYRHTTREHMRFAEGGGPLARIGVVRHVQPGQHTVSVRLDQPRLHDNHYNAEIEMIVLRPVADDLE